MSGDNTSIWKKEISFRRKPKKATAAEQQPTPVAPALPAAAPPMQLPPTEPSWPSTAYAPIKVPAPVETPSPVATPDVVAAPEDVPVSVEASATPVDEAPPAPAVQPAATPTFQLPPAEPTWPATGYARVEVPAPPAVSEVVVAPAPAEANVSDETPSDGTSVWKKEISFRRKPKAKATETETPLPVVPPAPEKPELVMAAAAVDVATLVETAVTSVDEAKPAKRSRFGRGEKQAKDSQIKAEKPAKQPKVKKEKVKKAGKQPHGERTVVGLRVGSSHLSAACIHANGSIEVTKLVRTALYPGVVAGGEVRDPESLGRELKTFFATNKLPRKNVRLGLASNRIGVRVIEVPKIEDPKLLANAIRFRAQEALSISVSDAVLDHVVLGDTTTESGEPALRVLLVFAHRETVDSYVEAFERAGVKLAGIDFEAFALLRALAEPRAETATPTQAVIALTIGHDRTIFAVSDGRICDFTRVLDWGGASLNAALARVLDISPAEAEVLKRRLSLAGELDDVGLSPIEVETVRDALRRELQVLAREFVSSLQFYQGRSGSLDIGEVLLTGGGAELGGMAEEFQRLVGVPVRVGDPFGRVTFAANVERPDDIGSLAIAVGLGIDD